jgi:hypothetical protein
MKHSIRLTGPNGAQTYLSHRGKSAFSPATARKYLTQWLQCNPGGTARIEDQFGDLVENPARLESRARKLYALRLLDPRAPQYSLADRLMDRARMIRETPTH